MCPGQVGMWWFQFKVCHRAGGNKAPVGVAPLGHRIFRVTVPTQVQVHVQVYFVSSHKNHLKKQKQKQIETAPS